MILTKELLSKHDELSDALQALIGAASLVEASTSTAYTHEPVNLVGPCMRLLDIQQRRRSNGGKKSAESRREKAAERKAKILHYTINLIERKIHLRDISGKVAREFSISERQARRYKRRALSEQTKSGSAHTEH